MRLVLGGTERGTLNMHGPIDCTCLGVLSYWGDAPVEISTTTGDRTTAGLNGVSIGLTADEARSLATTLVEAAGNADAF
jgi:hypothetical protein